MCVFEVTTVPGRQDGFLPGFRENRETMEGLLTLARQRSGFRGGVPSSICAVRDVFRVQGSAGPVFGMK